MRSARETTNRVSRLGSFDAPSLELRLKFVRCRIGLGLEVALQQALDQLEVLRWDNL
jgi:hypothetical protein